MKRFARYALPLGLFTFLLCQLTGCSENIEVVRPGKPFPVVFGVFDLNDAVQFVKVTKTFAGEEDPYLLAKDINEIFYPDAHVFLTRPGSGARMDFHLETDIPRDPGLFPEQPNRVYRLDRKLDAGAYNLTVILPSAGDTLTAPFTFIDAFRVITPRAGFRRFYFYEDPILFSWNSVPAAGLYEISLVLGYEEYLLNGDSVLREATYTRQIQRGELETDQDRYTYRFYSDGFFARLGTLIAVDPEVDYRKPVDLTLLITAADTTLARYLNWSNQEIDDKVNPNGNIEGAIGVVATKYTVPFRSLTLSPRSQDSLVRGRYTGKLDFVMNTDW